MTLTLVAAIAIIAAVLAVVAIVLSVAKGSAVRRTEQRVASIEKMVSRMNQGDVGAKVDHGFERVGERMGELVRLVNGVDDRLRRVERVTVGDDRRQTPSPIPKR